MFKHFLFFARSNIYNYITLREMFLYVLTQLSLLFKTLTAKFLYLYKTIFGEGFLYLRGLVVIFFVDANLTDDEPLWEPVE
jgi:hypothetical protein